MTENHDLTSQRKKEHIELCLTDEVAFKEKTTGFEKYVTSRPHPETTRIETLITKMMFLK